jgi:hypothetical protein
VLEARGLRPRFILTSAWQHARDTAELLQVPITRAVVNVEGLTPKTPESRLSLPDMLTEAAPHGVFFEGCDVLMLVGHEPRLSLLAGRLTGDTSSHSDALRRRSLTYAYRPLSVLPRPGGRNSHERRSRILGRLGRHKGAGGDRRQARCSRQAPKDEYKQLKDIFDRLGRADNDLFAQLAWTAEVLRHEARYAFDLVRDKRTDEALAHLAEGRTKFGAIQDNIQHIRNKLADLDQVLSALVFGQR